VIVFVRRVTMSYRMFSNAVESVKEAPIVVALIQEDQSGWCQQVRRLPTSSSISLYNTTIHFAPLVRGGRLRRRAGFLSGAISR
jgi:hypothetical protein